LARVWCGALQYVAGFGIGTYTFRVLNWVIVIMVFGALYLKDPERKRLTGWQGFIFSVIGIVGWVLGLILLAAVSGLTQSS
jgi:hypothetical protein